MRANESLLGFELLPAPSSEAPPIPKAEIPPVTIEDFDTVKLQIDETSQSMTDSLDLQRANLEKLTNQISTLVDEIDALQKAQASRAARAEITPEVLPRFARAAGRTYLLYAESHRLPVRLDQIRPIQSLRQPFLQYWGRSRAGSNEDYCLDASHRPLHGTPPEAAFHFPDPAFPANCPLEYRWQVLVEF